MKADLTTARRSNALMRALSTDFLLREQFVTDPAGLFTDYVGGKPLKAAEANAVNHLIFATVSNPEMLAWLHGLAGAKEADLSDAALAQGLAAAASRSGDPAVISALVRFGSQSKLQIAPALGVLRGVALGLHGVGPRAGTEATPGTGTNVSPGTGTNVSPGTGTNVSPGTGTNVSPAIPVAGTNVSPGTGTNVSPGTGTNVSPGTGTNVSPGTGTNISPAIPVAGTNVSPGIGTNVSPGTGTNVSPGTGTNVSPGTGTNVSLGGLLGRFGDFSVTLQALVDFATELRASGALTETGFR